MRRRSEIKYYSLLVGVVIFATFFAGTLFHYYNVGLKDNKLTFSALCVLVFPLIKKFIAAHKKIIENDNSEEKIKLWDTFQLLIEAFWLAGFMAGSIAIIITKYISIGPFSIIVGLVAVMVIMYLDGKAYKNRPQEDQEHK